MWIYLYINRPKKQKRKKVAGIKNIKNVYYIYATSYQCSNFLLVSEAV